MKSFRQEETIDSEAKKLVEGLHPLERKVLKAFERGGPIAEADLLASDPSLQPSQLSMALGWLLTKGILAVSAETRREEVSLTDVGQAYAEAKIPALRMLDQIRTQGQAPIRELQARTDMEAEEKSSAIGALKEAGAVRVLPGGMLEIADPEKAGEFDRLQGLIVRLRDRLSSQKELPLNDLPPEDREIIAAHHRRRGKGKGIFRIDERIDRTYSATPLFSEMAGSLAGKATGVEYGQLTPEMLKEGSWRGATPRSYNISLRPARTAPGRKNPYREFLDFVKEKLVGMGFEEMRGPLVESEFWNMDALFMPQFHPARDIHDVYYVKGAGKTGEIDEALIERVAAAHQGKGRPGGKKTEGEAASRGWRYVFDSERTKRLILRSQGTAVSARTLAAQPKTPGKYFSIARCFRYDQVDATHAPDFFQVEGIVLGEEINFRTLLGLLTLFAREVARAKEIKFLPAYFPFTEPSVEMHARHPELGWMELGGAGLLRPEVTRPLGVNVPVIAWGLGLDRMAMLVLGLSDIRSLFSGDLDLIRQKRIVL